MISQTMSKYAMSTRTTLAVGGNQHVIGSNSLSVFKSRLETFLFHISFN